MNLRECVLVLFNHFLFDKSNVVFAIVLLLFRTNS